MRGYSFEGVSAFDIFFFMKGFIDRLHVNFDILVISFLYFLNVFLCGANRLYVRLSLSHDFEQFGSLHTYVVFRYIQDQWLKT